MANLIDSHIIAFLIIISLTTMSVLSKFTDSPTPTVPTNGSTTRSY